MPRRVSPELCIAPIATPKQLVVHPLPLLLLLRRRLLLLPLLPLVLPHVGLAWQQQIPCFGKGTSHLREALRPDDVVQEDNMFARKQDHEDPCVLPHSHALMVILRAATGIGRRQAGLLIRRRQYVAGIILAKPPSVHMDSCRILCIHACMTRLHEVFDRGCLWPEALCNHRVSAA